MRTTTLTTTLATSAILVLALSGCGSPAQSSGASPAAAPSATAAAAAPELEVDDAWVKSAESGMSAAFGTIVNDSAQDVTIVSADSPASPMMELHETVANDAGEMVMRPRDGGFTIPAGDSLELAPGANHLMLMGLTAPLAAGDEIDVTLTLSDGSTYDFSAPVKDYSGANETYEGGDMDMDMDQ
ncbi:copper chaperone PCu(A)C [Clavibacter zhangzhiyongii]|uniref:Copper chaperone PCu(A)C n=1 Tax=Clavibacter zhangzhiyongii TaxID=2768071 RepID=A0A7L7YYV8_9MICO|nr:copper chaperone PCu(A)C [Clavibacter zhangzhiyongii]QOD42658.1 copper chaperone PCu(A)C [Clavibacter zhangzhiyongii]